MKGIKINRINSVNPGDPFKQTIELFKGEEGRQVTVNFRDEDSPHKSHYHEGIDPSKDPEKLCILEGKVKLLAENEHGERLELIIGIGEDKGSRHVTEITIDKGVKHDVVYLSKCIILEYRSTIFNPDKSDMHY
jgi:hypothetical protein